MKICPRCQKTKPLDQFERDKRKPHGRGSRCYDCTRARYNPAWQQSYRGRSPGADAARRKRNRAAKYDQERARDRMRYGSIEDRARHSIRNAVKSGKVIKPEACEQCRKKARLQAHHTDYEQPLAVKWLCAWYCPMSTPTVLFSGTGCPNFTGRKRHRTAAMIAVALVSLFLGLGGLAAKDGLHQFDRIERKLFLLGSIPSRMIGNDAGYLKDVAAISKPPEVACTRQSVLSETHKGGAIPCEGYPLGIGRARLVYFLDSGDEIAPLDFVCLLIGGVTIGEEHLSVSQRPHKISQI